MEDFVPKSNNSFAFNLPWREGRVVVGIKEIQLLLTITSGNSKDEQPSGLCASCMKGVLNVHLERYKLELYGRFTFGSTTYRVVPYTRSAWPRMVHAMPLFLNYLWNELHRGKIVTNCGSVHGSNDRLREVHEGTNKTEQQILGFLQLLFEIGRVCLQEIAQVITAREVISGPSEELFNMHDRYEDHH